MPISQKEQWFHRLFLFVIASRGVYGIFEILLGVLLLFTSSAIEIAHTLVQGELAEDPTDVVALLINDAANTWSLGVPVFVVIYLFCYGSVKVFLTIGLLKNKTWAYPTAVCLFSIFLIYQVYRIVETHSLILIIISVTDLLALLLVAHEYYGMRKKVFN